MWKKQMQGKSKVWSFNCEMFIENLSGDVEDTDLYTIQREVQAADIYLGIVIFKFVKSMKWNEFLQEVSVLRMSMDV